MFVVISNTNRCTSYNCINIFTNLQLCNWITIIEASLCGRIFFRALSIVAYRGTLLESRFTKTQHTYGVTVDSSWLEGQQQTQTHGVTVDSSWLEGQQQTHTHGVTVDSSWLEGQQRHTIQKSGVKKTKLTRCE